MPKVYFRTSDSKAISKEIASEVNYEDTLELIKGRFGIEKSKIKLMYNGQVKTENFQLSSQIPHHIVHILDKSTSADEELNVYLTISNGKGVRKIQNVKTNSKTTAKDLINHLYETDQINRNTSSPESAELYHAGKKISDDETFLDHGVQNNGNVNVLLRDDFPDPADIQTCTQDLYNTIAPIVMTLQMQPKYSTIATALTTVKSAGVFNDFQQRYQAQRVNVIYSDYQAYIFPTMPQEQPEEAPEQ